MSLVKGVFSWVNASSVVQSSVFRTKCNEVLVQRKDLNTQKSLMGGPRWFLVGSLGSPFISIKEFINSLPYDLEDWNLFRLCIKMLNIYRSFETHLTSFPPYASTKDINFSSGKEWFLWNYVLYALLWYGFHEHLKDASILFVISQILRLNMNSQFLF